MVRYEAVEGYREFIKDIDTYFNSTQSKTIFKERNEVKVVTYRDKNIIFKSFRIPYLLNRVAYSLLRDSKAKKSYEYSLKIGEFAPKPLGYVEVYRFGLLAESYFVSEHFKYDFTIREPLLDSSFQNQVDIFRAFARFTFDLHENGILHKDYSPGNILIKKEGDGYIFKIVDVNRMEFKQLSLNERLENFKMLWAKDEYMAIIIREYARLAGADEEYCIQRAIYYSQKQKDFKNMKKRLKGIKVVD